MWMSEENGTGIIFFSNFDDDGVPWNVIEERLMAVADTLGGPVGNPKFDKGILLVNGADFSTYGTEITSAYADKSFSGAYPISFWDCFPSAPPSGYPSNLPAPVGRGPIPLEVLGKYSTVLWLGNAYLGDATVWQATPIYSYLQLGGNVVLLTKNGSSFINSVLNDYLGFTWAEQSQTLANTSVSYPGLTMLHPFGAQSLNDVFLTALADSESTMLFTATGSFSGERGIGVWRKPSTGKFFRGTGGRFVYIAGRPYRWNHADLRASMEFILKNFAGEVLSTGGDVLSAIPKRFTLQQNYPNPFNPATVISYQLPVNSLVTLTVYDILGRKVTTLVNQEEPAGNHSVYWDAANFSSGVYFYQLKALQKDGGQAGNFVETKKMVLMK
jgi:hypothetical protein